MVLLPKEDQKADTQYVEIMLAQEAVATYLYYLQSKNRSPVETVYTWLKGTLDSVIPRTIDDTLNVVKDMSVEEARRISACPFKTLKDIERFVPEMMQLPLVRSLFPDVSRIRIDITAGEDADQMTNRVEGNVTKIGEDHYRITLWEDHSEGWPRPMVVVHEFAHIVCPEEPVPHGPHFVSAFLSLVEIVLGSVMRNLLEIQFRHRGVSMVQSQTEVKHEKVPGTSDLGLSYPSVDRRHV